MTTTDVNMIRLAVIGDFGQASATEAFPVDSVGALVRSWKPDYVMSLGDNNYILGEQATLDVNVGKNFGEYIYTPEPPPLTQHAQWLRPGSVQIHDHHRR